MSDVLIYVRSLDPCESRGVVVVDLDSGLRYKLISKKSTMLSKFMFTGEARDKDILETILYNEKNDAYQSDTLSHVRPQFEKLLQAFEKSVAKIEKELESSKQLNNRELGNRVRRIASGNIILNCRSKNLTVRQAIIKMAPSTVTRSLRELFKVEGIDLDHIQEPEPQVDDNPEEPGEDDVISLDEYNMM